MASTVASPSRAAIESGSPDRGREIGHGDGAATQHMRASSRTAD